MARMSAVERAQKKRRETLDAFEVDPFIGYETPTDAVNDCMCSSQVEVLARLLQRENLFISGPAGSGKTHIVQQFIKLLDAKFEGRFSVAVTASTGLAAALIDGRTVHSWSGLGILDKEFTTKDRISYAVRTRVKYTDVLIIDEISMLPAYYLDNIDRVCKTIRKNDEPFGGIQVVLLGDFLQLPPVAPRNGTNAANYQPAICSDAWKNGNIQYAYMDKVRRTADKRLLHLLRTIERGEMDEQSYHILEDCRTNTPDTNKTYTTLFTTNKNVNKYNEEQLASNQNPLKVFYAQKIFGNTDAVDKLIKTRNIPEVLELKIDSTVIVTANYYDTAMEQIVAANGSVGKITSISDNSVQVQLNNGNIVGITRLVYEAYRKKTITTSPENKIVEVDELEAQINQFPLKLGYAITVHKSQGQTFDAIKVDLSNCFTPGLGYVALSRARSVDDILLEGYDEKALQVSSRSQRISRYVKRRAYAARLKFAENPEDNSQILTNPLLAVCYWDEEEAGNVRRERDKKKDNT